MATSEEQLRTDILLYINGYSIAYSQWYVGIAADARDRLFRGHAVDEKNGVWIYGTATSSDVARRVERYFLDVVGTGGGPGGGDDKTNMVYAYRITNTTVE